MKKILYLMLAVTVLVLVGCSKEEDMSSPAAAAPATNAPAKAK